MVVILPYFTLRAIPKKGRGVMGQKPIKIYGEGGGDVFHFGGRVQIYAF